MIYFADKSLSQRLERTEGQANADFVDTMAKLTPDCSSTWMKQDGVYALFAGVESPLTQTFGLGLFENATAVGLSVIEDFFKKHAAPTIHEVSPLADPALMPLLHVRGYQPIEHSNVLYKWLTKDESLHSSVHGGITIRKLSSWHEKNMWAKTSALGWSVEMPGFENIMYQFANMIAHSNGVEAFIAEIDGSPIATAALYIAGETALLAADSTVAAGRNRGAQTALIKARLAHAATQGCSLGMMVTSPGSQSQKNGEKQDLRLAYTRTKWQL